MVVLDRGVTDSGHAMLLGEEKRKTYGFADGPDCTGVDTVDIFQG